MRRTTTTPPNHTTFSSGENSDQAMFAVRILSGLLGKQDTPTHDTEAEEDDEEDETMAKVTGKKRKANRRKSPSAKARPLQSAKDCLQSIMDDCMGALDLDDTQLDVKLAVLGEIARSDFVMFEEGAAAECVK